MEWQGPNKSKVHPRHKAKRFVHRGMQHRLVDNGITVRTTYDEESNTNSDR